MRENDNHIFLEKRERDGVTPKLTIWFKVTIWFRVV